MHDTVHTQMIDGVVDLESTPADRHGCREGSGDGAAVPAGGVAVGSGADLTAGRSRRDPVVALSPDAAAGIEDVVAEMAGATAAAHASRVGTGAGGAAAVLRGAVAASTWVPAVAPTDPGASTERAAQVEPGSVSESPDAAAALGFVAAAVSTLAHVRWVDAPDDVVQEAAVALQQLSAQIDAAAVAAVGVVDRRRLHAACGAANAASWLATRTGMDRGRARSIVSAGRRLPDLPRLRAAFAHGRVSTAHALAITTAAIPRRAPVIATAEANLVDLAEACPPQTVRRALRRLGDLCDTDGTDTPPLTEDGPDERRHLDLTCGFDGLWDLRATLDPLTGEALAAALDALHPIDQSSPCDPASPDAGRACRRSGRCDGACQPASPGQRRHDAFDALVRNALDSGRLPMSGGVRPHIHAVVDLATLLGLDELAVRTPRLDRAGPISPRVARRLLWEATVTCVVTMGPWRPVGVGRAQRALPSWLRAVLTALHHHCRGPDCDQPASWTTTEAHHVTPWADDGPTELDNLLPLCTTHHEMVTVGGWTLTWDPDTGIADWTSPDGRTHRVAAPAVIDPLGA